MKALSKALSAKVSSAIKNEISVDAGRENLVDLLIADGFGDPALYKAPATGEDRTFYDSLKTAVIKGFPAEAQMLLNADPKTLTGAQMEERRALQQKSGGYLGNIRNAITSRREKPKGNAKPATPDEAFIKELNKREASIRANAKDKPYNTNKVLGLIKELKAELSKTA